MANRWATHDIAGLTPANDVQLTAVRQAMTQPFSLIQGPPGTGKTVTAVRLASLFVRLNRELPSYYNNDKQVRPQVMICGPSNKSVDVVAGWQYLFCCHHVCCSPHIPVTRSSVRFVKSCILSFSILPF